MPFPHIAICWHISIRRGMNSSILMIQPPRHGRCPPRPRFSRQGISSWRKLGSLCSCVRPTGVPMGPTTTVPIWESVCSSKKIACSMIRITVRGRSSMVGPSSQVLFKMDCQIPFCSVNVYGATEKRRSILRSGICSPRKSQFNRHTCFRNTAVRMLLLSRSRTFHSQEEPGCSVAGCTHGTPTSIPRIPRPPIVGKGVAVSTAAKRSSQLEATMSIT